MRIFEVTTPYNNPYLPDDDIGLMTLSEFLYHRNPHGKSHPNEVYDTSLETMNRPDRLRTFIIGNMSELSNKQMTIQVTGSGISPTKKIVSADGEPIAVMIGDTLYYTLRFPVKQLIPFSYRNQFDEIIELKPTETKPVKYIKDYVDMVHRVKENNLEEYPHIIKRLLIDDEQLTIRTTDPLPYKKDSGKTVAILNSEDLIIASASDEWGATLLRVVKEYRGKNIGNILGKYWYEMNPSFTSGGFSPMGQQNAIKIWADRVRTFMKNGWYSDMVKKGELSPEKVKEIVSKLPEQKVYKNNKKASSSVEPLIYTDFDNSFVLYDKKFYEDKDEKYIYAFGFLREAGGKPYIFTLDYDKPYKDIATYIIFQIAYNNKQKLLIKSPPSDHVTVDGLAGIKIDGDYAYLTEPALNLTKYANAEKQYRNQHDKYDEIYYSLIELANSKWS